MEPALRAGDYVLVNRWAYVFSSPREGEVIVLRDPERAERFLVKRIAAVGEGGIVVAGDNKKYSRDSRKFGPVIRELLVGKVMVTVKR